MKSLLSTFILSSLSASAMTIAFDESVSGDISSNASSPTAIPFVTGANIVRGVVNDTLGDVRDFFTFEVLAGQSIANVSLLQYDNPATAAANDGNRGFFHMDDGASSVVPSPATSSSLLTGRTFIFSELDGVNLLATTNQTGGPGLSGSLGPGQYTFNLQNTTTSVASAYELSFEVVPEPSSLMLLGLAGLGLLRRKR